MSNPNLNHPVIKGIRYQRTFCMIKPDGVARGLVGEIIRRIENAGLKVVAMKMQTPSEELVKKHVPFENAAWVSRLGDKSFSGFEPLNLNPVEFLGTDDKAVIGKNVADNLVKFLCSGPVVAMVVEGVQAIDMIRKLAGHTLPFKAEMGTIRGDFSVDSPSIANVEGRAIHNLFHASETLEEATNEIGLWFPEASDQQSYSRTDEDTMYSKNY